jgi:flagellar biosynthesis protein FlhG
MRQYQFPVYLFFITVYIERKMVINENVDRKVIPVASGKGGVGKTVLAANLALALAESGKHTVLVDLDLGGSNLHTCLGLKNINPGVGNFLSGAELDFCDIIVETPYRRLRFIPGDVLVTGLAAINNPQKKRIAKQLLKIDADFIILDLGSGTSTAVLDFFLVSNSGIVVTTPQPTAVTNAFGFLKNLVFRFLQRALSSHQEVKRYITSLNKEHLPHSTPTVSQALSRIEEIDADSAKKARLYVTMIHPKLAINLAQSPGDLDAGLKLRDLVRKNLDIELDCMGLIYDDAAVEASVTEREPVLRFEPDAVASIQIKRIAEKIVKEPRFPLTSGDREGYGDSFELAHTEAKEDFKGRPDGSPRIVPSDIENLLQVITEQKKRINELQGTVRMLTLKDI